MSKSKEHISKRRKRTCTEWRPVFVKVHRALLFSCAVGEHQLTTSVHQEAQALLVDVGIGLRNSSSNVEERSGRPINSSPEKSSTLSMINKEARILTEYFSGLTSL